MLTTHLLKHHGSAQQRLQTCCSPGRPESRTWLSRVMEYCTSLRTQGKCLLPPRCTALRHSVRIWLVGELGSERAMSRFLHSAGTVWVCSCLCNSAHKGRTGDPPQVAGYAEVAGEVVLKVVIQVVYQDRHLVTPLSVWQRRARQGMERNKGMSSGKGQPPAPPLPSRPLPSAAASAVSVQASLPTDNAQDLSVCSLC